MINEQPSAIAAVGVGFVVNKQLCQGKHTAEIGGVNSECVSGDGVSGEKVGQVST